MHIREAFTFDDVLLEPAASSVLPGLADTRTRLTRGIELGIPLISAAMDTVTENRLAIAMAQLGGLGIVHKNFDPARQAQEVRAVKKFESGMVVNPVTIPPDQPLADALQAMLQHKISGIPVVERKTRKLVGILTTRDVRFATETSQPVHELMTKERLVTVKEGVGREQAKQLLHKHRIEKLIVVDDEYRCVGLITVKDIEKAALYPNATKDDQGRLRVGAATGVGRDGLARAEALLEADCDVIVVDTAHGHSDGVIGSVRDLRKLANSAQIIAGNIATADGAKALIDAGADAIKVGIGPGSICTTRVVAGVGVPQLTAILDAVEPVLGPDLFCWSSGFFHKRPGDGNYVPWHQDATYWGLSSPDVLTAWVAFTPSTPASGCMRVVPGTHKTTVPHEDKFDDKNMLSRGQEVAVEVDEKQVVDIVLKPGEISLHHVLIVHGSGINQTEVPRVGFAIRYVPTSVYQLNGHKESATLVRGTDRYGHFEHEQRPEGDMHPAAVERHRQITDRQLAILYAGAAQPGKRAQIA